MILYKAFIL